METVAVSQATVVSEVSAAVAPPVAVGAAAAFPPAVQDLARFFLSLTGSSSQGAVVGGATASTSGAGVQLCPSTLGGEAAALCATSATPSLTARPPSMPGSSGRWSREEEFSRSSRRRRRSSSGGTARASKRRPRDLTLSPVHSSLRREASYRSSSEFSEEGRVASPLPLLDALCLEVLPASLGPLRRVTARLALALRTGVCSLPLLLTDHAWVLVVICPPLLRERRTTTALVPSMPWTLTEMTLSGPSWPSSGTSIAWNSRQESPRLDARLLLLRSMG